MWSSTGTRSSLIRGRLAPAGRILTEPTRRRHGIRRAEGQAERDVGQRSVRAHHEDAARHARSSSIERADPQPGDRLLDAATGTGRGRDPRREARGRRRRNGPRARAHRDGARSEPRRRASRSTSRSAMPRGCRTRTRASTRSRRRVGVMFAPDHAAVAGELARVTRPGGRLVLACWTPEGGLGQMFGMMRPFLPPPPEGVGSPFTWGTRGARPGASGRDVRPRVRGARLRCSRVPSGEEYWELFSTSYGPTKTAADKARRGTTRGVPPDVGRLLRAASRGRRGRSPPRVPAHGRHASLSHGARRRQ